MAENIAAKLIASHLVSGKLEPGKEIALQIDQAQLFCSNASSFGKIEQAMKFSSRIRCP